MIDTSLSSRGTQGQGQPTFKGWSLSGPGPALHPDLASSCLYPLDPAVEDCGVNQFGEQIPLGCVCPHVLSPT